MERDYLSSLLNLFRKRINKIFVGLLVIIIAACDFDSPSDFAVPTWFIDIKLPLVSKRFPMGDLVDSVFIFPTDDTLGFQIFFGDSIDPPFQPDQVEQNVLFEDGRKVVNIPEIAFGGIDGSALDIPDVTIPPADFDPPAPINIPLSFSLTSPFYLDKDNRPFTFPILGNDVVMDASAYNTVFVDPMNNMLDQVFTLLSTTIELNLDIPPAMIPENADFIKGVKELIMADTVLNKYSTYFKNGGFPTKLKEVSSLLVTDTTDSNLNDTLAYDNTNAILTDSTFLDSTTLGNKALKNFLSVIISCELESAADDVTFKVGTDSLYIDFEIQLSTKVFESALVSIEGIPLPVPDMEQYTNQLQFSGNEGGDDDTQLELKSALLTGSDDLDISDPHEEGNTISFNKLKNTFPWDIEFYLEMPNFVPPAGGTPVLLDIVLSKPDDEDDPGINTTFNLYNHTILPTGGETTLGSLDIILELSTIDQDATIPLDGSDLGGFSLDIIFGSLFFESFTAEIINQTIAEDTLEIPQFPPEMSGIGFPELEFEFEFKYSLNLPLDINIKLLGYTGPTPDKIISPLTIDLKQPVTDYQLTAGEEIKMIIKWNRLGSISTVYAPHNSEQWTTSDTLEPVSGEVSIDQFFAGMPYDSAIAQVIAKIDGEAVIESGTGDISGGFSIKLPLSVTMNTPAFIPPSGVSTLDTMDHDIRNKIRHTLIYSELNTTVENSLPLGGEFAILLSNKDYFPKDITSEALSAYVDTMAIREPDDWDSDDELYIVTDCESLSPARHESVGGIYIFDVMSDSSECVEGVNYLVKTKKPGMDILVSYVDTLFRVILPDPESLYQDTNSEGHEGQVAVPGITSYSSVLDTGRIFLLTDYGKRYIVPRFSFNPTGPSERFFSRYDAIDIKSFITFRLASTGVLGETENDIVLKFPNGGENLMAGSDYMIRWKTYGSISNVDVHYAIGANPSDDDWEDIEVNIVNNDSLAWTPSFIADSVRIKIKDSSSELNDISGWYFNVSGTLLGRTSTGSAVINRGKLKRSGETR